MILYPPRAEHRITEDKMSEFSPVIWIAQPKANGTALIIICINRRLTIMNRHGKTYKIKISDEEILSIFPKAKDFIVCGEYLNKAQADERGEILRDKFVIWDLLSINDVDLVGQSLELRISTLLKYAKRGKVSKRLWLHKELTENIYIIKTFQKKFDDAFNLSSIPLVEGLVLKRRNALLKPCNRPDSNTGWQVKVRKSTKCYKF